MADWPNGRITHAQALRYTLQALARGTDAQASYGVGVAREHGLTDWYGTLLSDVRGWKD